MEGAIVKRSLRIGGVLKWANTQIGDIPGDPLLAKFLPHRNSQVRRLPITVVVRDMIAREKGGRGGFGMRTLGLALGMTAVFAGTAFAGGFELPAPPSLVLLVIGGVGAAWWLRRK